MIEDRVPASSVDPGWLVRHQERWLRVELVLDTERPDGTRWTWLYVGLPDGPLVLSSDDEIEVQQVINNEG